MDNLTFICHSPMSAWWGPILIPGEKYTGEIVYQSTEIITDYNNYYTKSSLVGSSFKYIREGFKEDDLYDLIPGYMKYSDITKLYTKRIDMPFFKTTGSDGNIISFCLLSDSELYDLGADKCPKGKEEFVFTPCFGLTVHRIDDYFDYTPTRRENRLKLLGIN